MVNLVKLNMNTLYEQTRRKDIDEEQSIRSEHWLRKNNYDQLVDYEPLASGEYVIKKEMILILLKQKSLKKVCSHF